MYFFLCIKRFRLLLKIYSLKCNLFFFLTQRFHVVFSSIVNTNNKVNLVDKALELFQLLQNFVSFYVASKINLIFDFPDILWFYVFTTNIPIQFNIKYIMRHIKYCVHLCRSKQKKNKRF